MRKPRVLLVNEASYRDSGYSRYGRELMTRLHKSNKYDLAELACAHTSYSSSNSVMEKCIRGSQNTPWPLYPAVPDERNQQAMQAFKSNKINEFGAFFFERTCLEFKPDTVISIRDNWMDQFIEYSPFRQYYNFVHLAPVDAEPQNPVWVDMYAGVDKLLTYNKWSKSVLERYGLEVHSDAPAKAPDCFTPMPKLECKANLGLPITGKIIGSVMRNQPRKLYDELFNAFAQFLNQTDEEVYLYIHTGYPDSSADIPDLLLRYGISDKVFITYKCLKCGAIDARRYAGVPAPCFNCYDISSETCIMENQVGDYELAHIFNAMDVYIQYACAEG